MIGVSEKDVKRVYLEETSGIYKIEQNDIGRLYDEILGFLRTWIVTGEKKVQGNTFPALFPILY